MFPAIPLSDFSQTLPPTSFTSDKLNSAAFINKMGFVYSIGLNKQLSELQYLATQIFKDIYQDFLQVGEHFSQLQLRVTSLKSKARLLTNPSYSNDPNKFAKLECAEFNDQHLNIKNSMNRLDTFLTDPEKVKPISLVTDLLKNIPSSSSMDKWRISTS